MGDTTDALALGGRNLVRNPAVVGLSYAAWLLAVPLLAIVSVVGLVFSVLLVGPLLFRLAVAILVKPLLFGGVAGVADGGFDGSARARDVVPVLREHSPSLVGGFLVYEAVVLGVVLALGAVGGTAYAAAATAGLDVVTSRAPLVGGGVGTLVVILLGTTFQFVDVAVVVGDRNALAAVKESLRLTVEDPVGVAGYTLLRVAIVAVVLLPGLVLAAATVPVPEVSPLAWWLVAALVPLAFAAVASVHAAYYRQRTRTR